MIRLSRLFRRQASGRPFPGKGTFAHGVHPPPRKNLSEDGPIEIVPTPAKVTLPLQQHVGGPCAPLVKGPARNLTGNPVRFVNRLLRLPRSLPNHRRLSREQRIEADYAILNDEAHDYSLLHYYIARDGQDRQLAAHGFELLACVDLAANEVGPGEQAFGCHELHYAARRLDREHPGA